MAMGFTPVVNTTGGMPLQHYADAHQVMRNFFSPETPNFSGKGDPDRGMDVLVDVVKGEGRVKTLEGRGIEKQGVDETVEWPTWLFLGKDGMEAARNRLGRMSEVMEKWEKVGSDFLSRRCGKTAFVIFITPNRLMVKSCCIASLLHVHRMLISARGDV